MNNENPIFAFVLMPFDTSFDDIYRLGIKDTATAQDMLAERVDEQIFQEGILERIYRQIELADVVIADMTGQNPNVFYEVGYAHAKGKLCILLTQRAEDIPFDLKHHRHIVYGTSGKAIGTLRERLAEELQWAKSHINTIRSSRIKVSMKDPSGQLEKGKYMAWATVDFKVDLHNEGTSPSAEIDAMYFYTSKGWKLTQDGRECGSTDSDVPDFPVRHFLNAPVRRLNKNGWAQLKYSGRRMVASAFDGEELMDSYRLSGKALIRIVAREGSFDYPVSLDVEVDEVPF